VNGRTHENAKFCLDKLPRALEYESSWACGSKAPFEGASVGATVPIPFDQGHQGDLDYTLLKKMLAMGPTERLRHHERWRAFVKGSSEMPPFVEDVVRRLAAGQVEFVIVGGVSAVLQGSTLTTRDLDLCYRRTTENIARLAAALAPLAPRPRGFPPGLPFVFDARTLQLGSNFTLEIGDEALDLLGDMSGVGGYEQIIDKAVELTVAGHPVKVLALEQLIATKKAAGRPKDLAVLPELVVLLESQREAGKGAAAPQRPNGPSAEASR
jgi:predicted nucleotidyltransferase